MPRGVYIRTEEHRKRMSLLKKGRERSEETCRKISKSNKGQHRSEETRRKLSEAHNGNKLSEETCRKISKSKKDLWKTKEHQEKMSKAFSLKPTKPELKLQVILNNLFPNEYKYVGNFQVWLGGKNPDFINVNGKKKLIEMFGNYWHKDKDEPKRIAHFKKYGFDTLVIWESELRDSQRLVGKLIKFNNV